MGGTRVKLISLQIEKLYGCYDYSVDFNPDVTFIYGTNGCGKTTILNITEAIITGQLFKLFDYNFKKIELVYSPKGDVKRKKRIEIEVAKHTLLVKFNDRKEEIFMHEDSIIADRKSKDIINRYFERYDILSKIKETFNYVYLPLNRSMAPFEKDEKYYYMQRYRLRMDSDFIFDINANDIAMTQIESLIEYNHSKINSTITKISDEFRNSILKSLLEFNQTYDIDTILSEMNLRNNTISSLQKIRSDYIKMLKELELLTATEEEKFNHFFDSFISDFIDFEKTMLKSHQ